MCHLISCPSVQMKITFSESTEVFEYPSFESGRDEAEPAQPSALDQLKANTPKGTPGNTFEESIINACAIPQVIFDESQILTMNCCHIAGYG